MGSQKADDRPMSCMRGHWRRLGTPPASADKRPLTPQAQQPRERSRTGAEVSQVILPKVTTAPSVDIPGRCRHILGEEGCDQALKPSIARGRIARYDAAHTSNGRVPDPRGPGDR